MTSVAGRHPSVQTRVMIVDDDPRFRALVRTLLEARGYASWPRPQTAPKHSSRPSLRRPTPPSSTFSCPTPTVSSSPVRSERPATACGHPHLDRPNPGPRGRARRESSARGRAQGRTGRHRSRVLTPRLSSVLGRTPRASVSQPYFRNRSSRHRRDMTSSAVISIKTTVPAGGVTTRPQRSPMIGTILNQVRQARALERANWTPTPSPKRSCSPTPSKHRGRPAALSRVLVGTAFRQTRVLATDGFLPAYRHERNHGASGEQPSPAAALLAARCGEDCREVRCSCWR